VNAEQGAVTLCMPRWRGAVAVATEDTMVTLENWRVRMSEDMRLRDFRPRTQEGYSLCVRQFLDRMQRESETLTDEDVRDYFLYLRDDKKLAPSSINIAVPALSDKAIVACDDHSVTFRYRNSNDHRQKRMTLPAHEFLRRFLQHVPIKGLHRVRAFGLLHPAHRLTWKRLQLLLSSPAASDSHTQKDEPRARPQLRCPSCHHVTLRLLRRLSPLECIAMALAAPTGARAPPSWLQLPTQASPP
jgi:hypothetical protein